MSIEIQHLKKYYGAQMGIEDVTLSVAPGAFYGFIGPNGAGKSTTLKVLMNVLFPTSGEANILGLDVVKSAMDLKHDIGYLPSEVNLYPDLKVKALFDMNIHYYGALKTKSQGLFSLPKAKRIARMQANKEALKAHLQLDEEKRFGELSFGNRKKVGYILSVLHDPTVILLDEPTSGLDPLIKDRLFEDLRARHEMGATIFFSSHNLDEVERYCDQVAFIKEGKIIQASTIESLKALSLKNVLLKVDQKDAKTSCEHLGETMAIDSVEMAGQYAFIRLKITDDYAEALKRFAVLPLIDITMESPSLEEIFKFYY